MQNAGNRLDIVVRKRYCHEKQKNVILFCKIKKYGEGILEIRKLSDGLGLLFLTSELD